MFQLLLASYSFYTWPSAPVLAWYVWENRSTFKGKKVLEIGSGTSLPGIVAAKCGASVTLSDSYTLPKSLAHIRRCCQLNNLVTNKNIRVVGLTWGLFLDNLNSLGSVDYILGSDCFYEPSVFEEILVTISYILDSNPKAVFLCTYQERSSDWTIEHLLAKWNLSCQLINITNLGKSVGLDTQELTGDRSIHLFEIKKH